MTRIPFESWNIVPRLDLPPYELNRACPVTGEVAGLEDHHILRKSFTALSKEDGKRLFWVELDDGTVVGNRINLSQSAHYRVTVNKARIEYEDGEFWWVEAGDEVLLDWQPPKWLEDGVEYAESTPMLETWIPPVEDGEVCPRCERRKPHKKKASSPKSKVFSTRIPLDDVETFNELVDAAAEHMQAKSKPYHVYNALLVGLALVLQTPKEHLPG